MKLLLLILLTTQYAPFCKETPYDDRFSVKILDDYNPNGGNSKWVDWIETWASQGSNASSNTSWIDVFSWTFGQGRWGFGYTENEFNQYKHYMSDSYFADWYHNLATGNRNDWSQFYYELKYGKSNPLSIGSEWTLLLFIPLYILYKFKTMKQFEATILFNNTTYIDVVNAPFKWIAWIMLKARNSGKILTIKTTH